MRSQFASLAATGESAKVDSKPQNGASAAAAFTSFAAVNPSNANNGFVSSGNGDAQPQVAQSMTLEESNEIWDWTARIRVKKYEIGCSFAVPLFLGDVTTNSEEWLTCDNFIGAYHAFVNG
jgi:tyrosinase